MIVLMVAGVVLFVAVKGAGQEVQAPSAPSMPGAKAPVPRLVRLSGVLKDAPVKPLHVANGDVYASLARSGVIVKSPDGTKCARIRIDDTGALLATALSCP